MCCDIEIFIDNI